MDIPNLSSPKTNSSTVNSSGFPLPVVILIVIASILTGFGLYKAFPQSKSSHSFLSSSTNQQTVSTDSITSQDQLKVGEVYGSTEDVFKDEATGTVQAGGLNGEGTHTLIRDGGPSQSAALTSSTVDLSLFVGKKVEIKGQTNKSNKVSWLLDVGNIKIVE